LSGGRQTNIEQNKRGDDGAKGLSMSILEEHLQMFYR
jgi:hypothetical protein